MRYRRHSRDVTSIADVTHVYNYVGDNADDNEMEKRGGGESIMKGDGFEIVTLPVSAQMMGEKSRGGRGMDDSPLPNAKFRGRRGVNDRPLPKAKSRGERGIYDSPLPKANSRGEREVNDSPLSKAKSSRERGVNDIPLSPSWITREVKGWGESELVVEVEEIYGEFDMTVLSRNDEGFTPINTDAEQRIGYSSQNSKRLSLRTIFI